ncbi:hypothetical protein Bhyg_04265 [Pseudolycoriella hygida]|uniref:THAP-type domain-containing protein n=1 Tax=Pseudolycoriella hygida TaxID=35572 RepID=A0A9Q0NF33_9DIPT|nr:hypothetical protein Bhyg_04265 [Pseudolycoriella hygida]
MLNMVQSCLIIACKSRYNKSDGISFFSFPSNKIESEKWRDSILNNQKGVYGGRSVTTNDFPSNKIESEKWRDSILNNQKGVITKNSKICQFHFNEISIN